MKGTVRVCVCVNANACKRERLCTAVSLLDEVTTERTKKRADLDHLGCVWEGLHVRRTVALFSHLTGVHELIGWGCTV